MLELDEFKRYLPKYLSPPAQQSLFSELRQFPDNIDQRMYLPRAVTARELYQGDGLSNLWIANLPKEGMKQGRALVLSNSCDISDVNDRLLAINIFYCPIISLRKYTELVANLRPVPHVGNHVEAIRKQQISSIFYLPSNELLTEDCIALLDRITSCDSRAYALEDLLRTRLFTLSNYGFYLLLYKLSIHFTRIREGLDRDAQLN